MPTTRRVVVVSAAVAVVLLGLGVVAPRPDAARAVDDPAVRLEQHLTAVEAAVAANDLSGAVLRWHDAYTAALATRQWEPMVRVGDAAMSVASIATYKKGFEQSARGAYLVAHDRARRVMSDEGRLRAADSLAALGDERLARALRQLTAAVTTDE